MNHEITRKKYLVYGPNQFEGQSYYDLDKAIEAAKRLLAFGRTVKIVPFNETTVDMRGKKFLGHDL